MKQKVQPLFTILRRSISVTRALMALFTSTTFWALTIFSNLFVFFASSLFYFFEKVKNPHITDFSDSLWWTFTTITSVGYGDIVPVTNLGRILGVLIMLSGTTIHATYTALIVQVLINQEVFKIKTLFKK